MHQHNKKKIRRYFLGAVALVHFLVHSREHFLPVLQDCSSSSTEKKRTGALQGKSETNYWQSHCNFYPITRALSPSALWENQHSIQRKKRWKEKKKSFSIAIELTAVCAGLFCEKRTARGNVLRYLFGLRELGVGRGLAIRSLDKIGEAKRSCLLSLWHVGNIINVFFVFFY